MKKEKMCYVIMPFSPTKSTEDWNRVYEKVFRPAIEKSSFNYVCHKSKIKNVSFSEDIIKNLKNADVVLADLTDFNPNVMWELGIRHTLSTRTIMICQKEQIDKLPSDIRHFGVIGYGKEITDAEEFKEEIEKMLLELNSDPELNTSPVRNVLTAEDLILSSYGRKQIINKLVGLMTEIGTNLELTNGILSKKIVVGEGDDRITSLRYNMNGLKKLLVENYVNGGKEYVKLLQDIQINCTANNHRLDVSSTTASNEHRQAVVKALMGTTNELKTDLTKLMKLTKELYVDVKSNSLIDVEPSVTISEELAKEFFE